MANKKISQFNENPDPAVSDYGLQNDDSANPLATKRVKNVNFYKTIAGLVESASPDNGMFVAVFKPDGSPGKISFANHLKLFTEADVVNSGSSSQQISVYVNGVVKRITLLNLLKVLSSLDDIGALNGNYVFYVASTANATPKKTTLTGLKTWLQNNLNLSGDKITSGTLPVERIPNLNANKITAGVFNKDRIPKPNNVSFNYTTPEAITLNSNNFAVVSTLLGGVNRWGTIDIPVVGLIKRSPLIVSEKHKKLFQIIGTSRWIDYVNLQDDGSPTGNKLSFQIPDSRKGYGAFSDKHNKWYLIRTSGDNYYTTATSAGLMTNNASDYTAFTRNSGNTSIVGVAFSDKHNILFSLDNSDNAIYWRTTDNSGVPNGSWSQFNLGENLIERALTIDDENGYLYYIVNNQDIKKLKFTSAGPTGSPQIVNLSLPTEHTGVIYAFCLSSSKMFYTYILNSVNSTFYISANENQRILGISTEAAAANASTQLITRGEVSGLTGLTANETITHYGLPVAKALSNTKMLVI